jgi:hypothetical protein
MRVLTCARTLATLTITALATLAVAQGAAAQSTPAGPAGLGDQLFSTGGDITIEVRPATAALVSELRLFAPDGSFTSIATNKQVGKVVTLPARPKNEELVFGIFIASQSNTTFKMGPADRNPDKLAHAVVLKTGERQYDVGFEDLLNGGDRDYDDNTFRFSGGLAPNRSPVPAEQSLSVAQGGSLPITLAATDDDGDALVYAISAPPLHGALTGKGTALTYTPAADFSGTDTFAFTATDGLSTPAEGRITISVTPAPPTPGPAPPPTTGSGFSFGDCPVGELTLVNVLRVGRRVRLSGLAEPTLAGAPVNITEGGLTVVRTTIRPDGSFSASVPVPLQRGGRVLRYQARIGLLHSRNLRLRRRMITTSAGLSRGKVVLRGRVTDVKRLRRAPVVDLYARPRGCGKGSYVRVGRARLARNGAFTVSGPPLKGVSVAVYRATTRLPRGRTFTLPQTIARR